MIPHALLLNNKNQQKGQTMPHPAILKMQMQIELDRSHDFHFSCYAL